MKDKVCLAILQGMRELYLNQMKIHKKPVNRKTFRLIVLVNIHVLYNLKFSTSAQAKLQKHHRSNKRIIRLRICFVLRLSLNLIFRVEFHNNSFILNMFIFNSINY